MAKAHWDNPNLLEALRSKEPQPTALQLLNEARKLERWEIEMIIDALQAHLDD